MKLQVIIGKSRGKVRDYNLSAIRSYIDNLDRDYSAIMRNAGETNVSKIRDFHHPESVAPAYKGKNLYFTIPRITDPQSFFRCLSNYGYVVRDSKLTPEAHKKDSSKRSDISGNSPYISPRGNTEKNPDKLEQIQGAQ